MNCFRILLYLFNILFIILGIILVAIGIWTAVEKIYVSHVIGDNLFAAASYLIIAVGIFLILICIVGILVLWKDKRKWLITYLCLLILSFVILITAAVLAIVFKGEVESVMVNNMRRSMINGYGKDRDITSAWDQLQSQLHCCAVSETVLSPSPLFNFPYVDGSSPQNLDERAKQDSWAIYKRTEFYKNQLMVGENERKYVPPSCCVYDDKLRGYKNVKTCQYFSLGPPVNYAAGHQNENLHYTGCYEKGKQFVLEQSDILVAIGFVFAFLMVAGMVLTFFVIRSATDDGSKHRRRPNSVVV
ncbi:unnamed protein product [Candidula unifasciata]|uniref:Tetraspanin n=1 Tax=Candidula unifasciata TaxID=100452 RepID=A0A8S3Z3R9_9EUPU|nr:unnamed protein product [Candidula unifasciata]